ncbi:MAG: DUF4838 domain-containing protein [Lentisphaerae bacterium]|nr:DUF4838 domain-containing protein [Lentisphaerota bacterium]
MSRSIRRFLGVVAMAMAAAGADLRAQDAGLTLAAGGTSDYTIVIPEPASPSQVYAAEELRDFTRQMTGAVLPIVTDARDLPPKAICLGVTRHTERVLGRRVDLERLGDDGFVLATRSPHLILAGSDVRGTLYAVYELLERYGGCRWYASWYSVIPTREPWRIPAVDDTQIPAFVMREPFWFDMFKGDFAARCRANGNRMLLEERHGGKIRFGAGLFVHTFNRLMPPGEFFAEHPEYYSEINGTRRADHAQLCLTNPDVIRICTERLLERIRSDPTAKLFSLSQNDWGNHCQCPSCREIDEREGSPAGSLLHFVNQVAEAVEREFPEVWIETLAYQYTRHPPRTIRPRHNVVVRLCTIECDFSLPLDISPYDQNVRFVEDIRGWSAITGKLFIWDYTTNFRHYIGPHPNFNCLQGNVRFFRDNQVVGLFEQGAYQGRHAEFAEVRAWILAKLLWDPDRDIEALYQDVFSGYYGPAAPLIREYFDRLQELSRPPERTLRIGSPPTQEWYTDEFFEWGHEKWRAAERLVAHDPALSYNVRMGAIPVLYAKLARWPRMTIGHEYRDGRFAATGVDPGYAALAADLLARIDEAGDLRVAENMDVHRHFLTTLRSRTRGIPTLGLTAKGVLAEVSPEMGGTVCLLAAENRENVLAPSGGLTCIDAPRDLLPGEPLVYAPSQKTDAGVRVAYTHRHRYTVERTVSLEPNRMRLASTFVSHQTDPRTLAPAIIAALDLGNSSAVAIRAGDETAWKTVVVPADEILRFVDIPGAGLGGELLTLASPVTGRGLALHLPNRPIERVGLLCEPRLGRIRVIVRLEPGELPGNGSLALDTAAVPLYEVPGLPNVEVPGTHSAARFIVEDGFLPIGRRGEWGDHVRDPKAADGAALKLYNSHYEWCMQWRFDPAWFDPETPYTVRLRLRVEKGQRDGEAFWAGVYDTARRKGYGRIAPRTDAVDDGYQWYDVATWVPEAEQYIWAGPGRFDKGAGEASAIEAVYIDCIELVRQPD